MELKFDSMLIFVSFLKTFNRTAYGIEIVHLLAFSLFAAASFNRTAYGIEIVLPVTCIK